MKDKKMEERKKVLKEEYERLIKDSQIMSENMRKNEARRFQLQGAFIEIERLEKEEEKPKIIK